MDNYCYPNSKVLINKLDIRDSEELHEKERDFSGYRLTQLEINPIQGNFGLTYLQMIHKYLFRDIYEWAGQIRIVDIQKGNSLFALNQNIKPLLGNLHLKLENENFLKGLPIDKFSKRFAYYAAEINAYHPFREGNGRTTREFLRCLAKEAGYIINYSEIDKYELYRAFVNSFKGNNNELKDVFKDHIMDSIVRYYDDQLPGISQASEALLNNLNKIRNEFSQGSFCSVDQLKGLYKELGSKIDLGLLDTDNSTFRLLSDTIIEIRKLQVYSPQNDRFNENLVSYRPEQNLGPEL